MNACKASFRLLLILGLFAATYASPAGATTTYTYTGKPFTYLLGTTCPPECELSGTFTLSDPIGANATDVFVIPQSFSFSDGLVTITNDNATGANFGFIATDPSGVITTWNMEWFLDDYSMFSGTAPAFCTGCSVIDVTFNADRNHKENITVAAAVSNSPGVWTTTTTTTAISEPADLLLIAAAMVCVIATRRKSSRLDL
jgi:hypothetical protein